MEADMETKPTIETVLERLAAMEERINARFDRLEGEMKLLVRKMDALVKSNFDHDVRIEALEELTTELTRPLPKN
jgi:serine/threonine protein kinase HipA of HipAB toxin-antitoxin module